MDTPSFKEDHISQIPALQMLVNLGYTYLNPAESDRLRGGKTTNVLLKDVLRKQVKEINSIRVSATKTGIFVDENRLNSLYLKGLMIKSSIDLKREKGIGLLMKELIPNQYGFLLPLIMVQIIRDLLEF